MVNLDVFKRADGQWGWRLISPNGQVIATAGEGFTRKWSAKRAGRRVIRLSDSNVKESHHE